MRKLLGIVCCLVVLGTAACGSDGDAPNAAEIRDLRQKADHFAIAKIEETWHKATTLKDIDLMMSLWADRGILHVGSLTYTGKDQIRDFFATKASPFKKENNWISDHPAYKMVITVDGDDATLYFECHFVDVASRTVKAVIGADLRLERIKGKWLITNNVSASPALAA
jgi:ketosteroid isomerase-like protein